ncbi:hypothetical protein DRJ17_07330 [Candidatus Woesearchaeota archaeon]|nr:MAG: hypothetical protein DRJ17_07330 [Candidatus Woesearchaeota archaeon]
MSIRVELDTSKLLKPVYDNIAQNSVYSIKLWKYFRLGYGKNIINSGSVGASSFADNIITFDRPAIVQFAQLKFTTIGEVDLLAWILARKKGYKNMLILSVDKSTSPNAVFNNVLLVNDEVEIDLLAENPDSVTHNYIYGLQYIEVDADVIVEHREGTVPASSTLDIDIQDDILLFAVGGTVKGLASGSKAQIIITDGTNELIVAESIYDTLSKRPYVSNFYADTLLLKQIPIPCTKDVWIRIRLINTQTVDNDYKVMWIGVVP